MRKGRIGDDKSGEDKRGFLQDLLRHGIPPKSRGSIAIRRPLDIPRRRPDKTRRKNGKLMSPNELEKTIDEAFDKRDGISPATKGAVREAVDASLDLLDTGKARVAQRAADGKWAVNQWLKKAVLLSFRLNDMTTIGGAPGNASWWDKVPSKFDGWGDNRFREAGFRAVPGSVVRRSAYIAPGVVLMPSFVNLGAYVDSGTMVDTWATIGSCAQIGKNCHISGGAGIGGVLEPLQAGPVIIEDNCFVGARSEVAEGVIVRTGAVLSMGVFLGASTKIVDRDSGKVMQGEVPAYSVVVPGSLPGKNGGPSLYCAVIVKRVDEQTRSKTSINELLRD
jgi:2,3,4,5-tetrahydropyridine-2-carboxylate N-succinyltransferase